MAHATRIEMPNGDTLDIKALIDESGCGERLHRVPMRVYTVSCDDILFRTCVARRNGVNGDEISTTNEDTSSSSSSSSWTPRQR